MCGIYCSLIRKVTLSREKWKLMEDLERFGSFLNFQNNEWDLGR